GHFYEPTVLSGVDHSMLVMQEETFGPVVPVMTVRDADEALRLANDTGYGLNASVWTSDIERGIALARRIESGNACVNECLVSAGIPGLPFGGVKQSGVGRRHEGAGGGGGSGLVCGGPAPAGGAGAGRAGADLVPVLDEAGPPARAGHGGALRLVAPCGFGCASARAGSAPRGSRQ